MKEEFISLPLQLEVPQSDGEFRLGLMFRESLEQDRGMLFIFENTDHHSFHMKNTFIPLDIAFINEEGVIESIKELDPMNPIPVYPDGDIRYAIEVNRGWFAENGVVVGDILLEDIQEHHKKDADGNTIPHEHEEELNEVKDKKGKGSGTKDACYHKVKSRYSVWPSAYASGALVKCRKVGAANWGNSTKKEEYNLEEKKAQKCWPGYEKKGTKIMFGKRYNNCVKKEEFSDWRDELGYEGKDDSKKLQEDDMKGMSVKSGHKRPTKSGAGMTQKGVEAYRRRNPGSKLKTAVTTKPSKLKKGSKAANRRKSYCARSAGQMKKFPKAAKDPNSRLRQARRRWNC